MIAFLKRDFLGIPVYVSLFLLSLSIACQLPAFSHPFLGIDQEYYMYAGGRMLRGWIPYVDFWDRKPVGLFLLFSFFHSFGEYRFVALTLFVAIFGYIGSVAVARISQCFTTENGSIVTAAIFILVAPVFECIGGQSESFYVPLVLLAMALFTTQYREILQSPKNLFKTGCYCMLLFGVALEIKPSCIWEGIYLGIWLLYIASQIPRLTLNDKIKYVLGSATVWVFLALLPSLIIFIWYVVHGYGHEWFFSNIISYYLKPFFVDGTGNLHRFEKRCVELLVYLIAVGLLFRITPIVASKEQRNLYSFMWGWVTVAAISVLLVKGWHDYSVVSASGAYAVLLAMIWQRSLIKSVVVAFAILLCSVACYTEMTVYTKNRSKDYETLEQLLAKQPGCLWEYSVRHVLYDGSFATAECKVSKWSFPYHLSDRTEDSATIGVDISKEIGRVLKLRPLYVLNSPDFKRDDINHRNLVHKFLEVNYTPIGIVREYSRRTILYKLKPGIFPKIAPAGYDRFPSSLVNR